MGLFNKLFHPNTTSNSSSTWAIIPSSDEITRPCQCSHKKRDFCNSLTSQESIVMDEATISSTSNLPSTKFSINSSNDDVNTPSQKVQLLQRQLQQKDAAISQLCQTMEATEKVQSERIYLLERQLELLVELSSSECAAYQGCKSSSRLLNLPKTNKHHHNAKEDDSHHKSTKEHQQAKIEIAVLQELLARVVAEKDRLSMKNNNFKSLLKEDCYSSMSSESSNMPSSIKQLDIIIHHKERKTKYRGDINNCQQDHHIGSNDESCQGDNSNDIHHIEKESSKNESSPPASSEEQHSVLYQMFCRNCPTDQSHAKFVGGYSTTSDNSTRDLITIVTYHFSQVWKMVQQQREDGKIFSSTHNGKEWNRERSNSGTSGNSGAFPSSSLARHLVMKHCRHFSKEEEVLQWCMENIKVEIRREKKKGQSKRNRKKN